MTVTVEPITIVAQPVVLTAPDIPGPIDIDVTSATPVIVDVMAMTMAVDMPTGLTGDIGTGLTATIAVAGAQGIPGPPGPPGSGTFITGESLTGVINGINTVFTTSMTFQAGSTGVYLNGLREFRGEAYTETTSTTIELSDAPLPGDTLRIDYVVL